MITNFDLDDYVSVAVNFRKDKMEFHFADDDFGVKWHPTKKTIKKFIQILKNIESKMTDETNHCEEED